MRVPGPKNTLFFLTFWVAVVTVVLMIKHPWYANEPLTVHLEAIPVTVSFDGDLVVPSTDDGNAIKLEAIVEGGVPPYGYVWLRDGVPIDAASKSTLLVKGGTTADKGAYSVQVTDSSW